MVINNLVKQIINNGGNIYPLIIPSEYTNGTGLCNPSIYNDNGKILINLRHVQYTLYHTNGKYENKYGPLVYLNPENDITLRTTNWILEWDNKIISYNKVDTSKLDIEPKWEFIGLEDARIVKWNNNLYLTGVRRDTTTNGEGRMELSLIKDYKEIKRTRIQPPTESYCEKNWMPINDLPFHYVKWSNPTEVVKVIDNQAHTVYLGKLFYTEKDLRGGGNIIRIGDKRIGINHQTKLWKNQQNNKEATYTHNFIVWDLEWNVLKISREFNFLGGMIEFSCGLAEKEDKILITFGYEDSAAYLVEVPIQWLLNWIYE
jgi:hypothetical protein